MKLFLSAILLLSCVLAQAADSEGYIVNKMIDDDGGVKMVVSQKTNPSSSDDVKTIYMSNTQPNFAETKQLLLDSKQNKLRLNLNKDAMKNLIVKKIGQ